MLSQPALFTRVTDSLAEAAEPLHVSHVVAIESRGFLFAAPVAFVVSRLHPVKIHFPPISG